LRYTLIRAVLVTVIALSLTAILISGIMHVEGKELVEWERVYGGTEDDWLISVAAYPDGGYVLAGGTESKGAGGEDGWVTKVNSTGYEQWTKTYGGPGPDEFESVAVCPDGGYVLAGEFFSSDSNGSDGWVLKLDSAGNVQWNRLYGGAHVDLFDSVAVCQDGGFLLAGVTDSMGAGSGDGWVVKLDSAGDTQWSRTFGGPDYDHLNSVDVCPDGGYIAAGVTYSSGWRYYNGWVVKLDSAGEQLWNRTFGGGFDDWFYSVVATPDGGCVLAGWSSSQGTGGYDGWVLKLNSTGYEEWLRVLGNAVEEMLWSVVMTHDGGYVVAGWMNIADWEGACEGWVLKLNSTGYEQWSGLLGDWKDDGFYDVALGTDGGYVLAGWTESTGAGGFDGWLVKLTTTRLEAIKTSTVIFVFGVLLPAVTVMVLEFWRYRQKKRFL